MESWVTILLVLVILAGIGVGLYFWSKKLKKKYDEQQQMINQHKQLVQMFVIDKKKDTVDNMKLPKQIKEQIPKMQRKRKMPFVIVKAGPQIQTLLCENSVYDTIPVKKQIKAEVAGIMLVNVVSGKLPTPKKQKFTAKMKNKAEQLKNKL
ncbi:MAG: hypothetical protein ACRCSG_02380 [Cellulosilyticaceae bacterium]